MNCELRINMLGPLQVLVKGETAVFRTDALRVLLAYLAAHQAIPQRRDTLATLLSPDRPDKEALTYLRNRLTRLRRALYDDEVSPPWFNIDRKQITLRAGDDIVIDVIRFDQLLTAVETHPHRQLAGCPTCLAKLQEAADLMRGEFLAGLNFSSDSWESWLLNQREHYQQRWLEGLKQLREARLSRGEWTAVLEIAQRQLAAEPWLEAAHRAMMQAHFHLGDRNAALAQYEQCAQQLWDELGVEPELETQQLRQQIFDDALGWEETAVDDNLPLQTGRFFGRESEQTQLLQKIVNPHYRLLTLVGTGGMGKTRLALEVSRQVKTSFPDGVWFVPLDAIKGGAEQIKIAVGEAVGLGQNDKQLTGEQVLTILRDKQLLLILDNCETVLEEIGFIGEWLRRAPNLAILATSREPLNFQAESVITLDGLPTGTAEGTAELNAAEALFVERGQMARDEFTLSAENLPQVRHICKLLDGSPLGIALAAAWVRRRSLAQIAEEISRSLDFLTTRLRDVDPRHRSMRAVFETSWQLLEPDEQALLTALAVFPTTFTATAAAQVAGATLYDLDLLCEKSLLQQQHEPARYLMHSLVRQFAAEKLGGQKAAVDKQFIDYFYHYGETHQTDYEVLRPEWRNLSAAITKAHALADWQTVLNLVQILDEPWFRQIRFSDMREGLTLALEAAERLADESAVARTLLRLGEIEMELNDYAAAERHLYKATERLMRLEDSLGIAQAKYLVGRIKMEQTEDAAALNLFKESKRIFVEEADQFGIAKNLNLIAMCIIKQRADFKGGYALLEQSVQIQEQLPPSVTYIEALRYLARVQGIMGEPEAAEQALIEATSASQILQDVGEYAAVLFERIVLCRREDQIDDALQFAIECLDQFQQLGSLRWEALVKTQLGILHQAKQNYEQAMTYFNDSLNLFLELGDIYEEAYAHCFLYKLHQTLGNSQHSLAHKQKATLINETLNDPEINRRLEQE